MSPGTLAADEPFVDWSWVEDHTEEIAEALRQHVQLTVTSVAIGFALSLVLGLVAVRWRWTYEPLAGICSVLYAIPSLALFAVLVSIPFFGLGYRTSLVALVSYTLLILLRNIVAGLDGVSPAVREASDGMGYERWRRVLRVDLPLATPSIVAGLRIATVTTVGLVTVTSLVGEGGFGKLINDGLSRNFSTPIVVGTVGSIALAIAFDLAFVVAEWLITPWTRAKAPTGGGRGRTRADEGAEASVRAAQAEKWATLARETGGGGWSGERANHEHGAAPGPKGRALTARIPKGAPVNESLQQMWDYLGSDAAWSGRNGLPALTWAHIRISVVAILFAAAIGIPTGVFLGHVRRGAFVAVSVVNIGRAIPSFAILALLLPFSLRYGFGLGFWPTIVALVLLAIPPIFTNTYTGVRDVPDEAVEAARGMGMRGGELVRKVEVPVAIPLILTGLRVSAVQVVATATLGALVGYRDLGTPIVSGFTSPDKGPMLAGAIAVALLALLTDASLAWTERRLVPWRRLPTRADDVTLAADELDGGVPAGAAG